MGFFGIVVQFVAFDEVLRIPWRFLAILAHVNGVFEPHLHIRGVLIAPSFTFKTGQWVPFEIL